MRNIWVLWVQPIPPPRLIKVPGSHHLSDKSQCLWTPCCSHGPSVIVRSRCLNLRDPVRYKRTGCARAGLPEARTGERNAPARAATPQPSRSQMEHTLSVISQSFLSVSFLINEFWV